MAGFIGNMVFKRILGETVANKHGTEDPYFEYVGAHDIAHKPNKKLKRQKKALPEGISAHDAKILTKVKRRAYRLDNNINICGIRFGWSSIIGLVPGFGDGIDIALALLVFKTCCQVEGNLPNHVKSKMMLNIAFDFVIGLVPFLGDLADAFFRCNTKNAILLEEYLAEKYSSKRNSKPSRRRTNDVEMTGPRKIGTGDALPGYSPHPAEGGPGGEPRRPDQAVVKKSQRTGTGRWFGSGVQRQEPDLERGGEPEPEYEYRPAQPSHTRP